jgi:hypothetical protein
MVVGRRTKYGAAGATFWKRTPNAGGGDNPQSNPNVARRRRLGMTPRSGAGTGETSKRSKGGAK